MSAGRVCNSSSPFIKEALIIVEEQLVWIYAFNGHETNEVLQNEVLSLSPNIKLLIVQHEKND